MYVPTIEVGTEEHDRLANHEMDLTPGQWFKVEWADNPSRFVGVSPAGVIWATHKGGHKNFPQMRKNFLKRYEQ